jgi:hypothetical protein
LARRLKELEAPKPPLPPQPKHHKGAGASHKKSHKKKEPGPEKLITTVGLATLFTALYCASKHIQLAADSRYGTVRVTPN